jgi:hypothetical protein
VEQRPFRRLPLVEVRRRGERAQDPQRVGAVGVARRGADVAGELEERRGEDGGGGGVVGSPRVEVPARDAARRQTRQEEVRGPSRRLEHAAVARVPVDQGEPVDGPRLAAGPGRAVRRALEGAPPAELARARVVVRDVERAAVGAHQVGARPERVLERHSGVRRIAAVVRRPEQQLEVHHRVDHDGEPPVGVPVAAVDGAHLGPEARRERGGAGEEDVPVRRIAGEPEGVAEAGDELEADVVRLGVRLLRLEGRGEAFGALAPGGVAAPLVQEPEHPGEEPLRPPDAIRRRDRQPQTVRPGALRQVVGLEARRGVRELALRDGERPLSRLLVERSGGGDPGGERRDRDERRTRSRASPRRPHARPPRRKDRRCSARRGAAATGPAPAPSAVSTNPASAVVRGAAARRAAQVCRNSGEA